MLLARSMLFGALWAPASQVCGSRLRAELVEECDGATSATAGQTAIVLPHKVMRASKCTMPEHPERWTLENVLNVHACTCMFLPPFRKKRSLHYMSPGWASAGQSKPTIQLRRFESWRWLTMSEAIRAAECRTWHLASCRNFRETTAESNARLYVQRALDFGQLNVRGSCW